MEDSNFFYAKCNNYSHFSNCLIGIVLCIYHHCRSHEQGAIASLVGVLKRKHSREAELCRMHMLEWRVAVPD